MGLVFYDTITGLSLFPHSHLNSKDSKSVSYRRNCNTGMKYRLPFFFDIFLILNAQSSQNNYTRAFFSDDFIVRDYSFVVFTILLLTKVHENFKISGRNCLRS